MKSIGLPILTKNIYTQINRLTEKEKGKVYTLESI